MGYSHKKKGDEGEALAAKFLSDLGYQILERNYRFDRGEIDIIAKENDTLVFVEVKKRENLEFGEPEYAITKRKISQVSKVALGYFSEKEIGEVETRFDVIAILEYPGEPPIINHYKDAFRL